ncbi:hypothetical protein [Thauera sp.]|uniref:hypothetical protein n=1 Tax=Thauera sp. TaxID=1905334 RepID=UPI0025803F1D|nr:hypothetical protein [Thauera sp.]
MRRLLVLFVTLISLLCQSMAVARADSASTSPSDLEHSSLHWQATGHHHHHDGSFHQDQSDESLQHVSSDHIGGHLELLGSISHALPPAGSVLPSEWHDAAAPDPFPDGLLRPPSPRS